MQTHIRCMSYTSNCIKGTVHLKIQKTYFSSYLRIVFIHLDCLGVSCQVLEFACPNFFFLSTELHSNTTQKEASGWEARAQYMDVKLAILVISPLVCE